MKNILTILAFLFFVLLISYKVSPLYGGITYSDTAYFWNFDKSYFQVASTYSENYLGTDQSSGMFGFFSKGVFIFLLRSIGINHDFISYLTSFGFVFLAVSISFIVFKKISKNTYFGIFAGIFIVLNNISLEHIVYGGMVFHFLSLISFLLLCYLFWLAYLDRKIDYRLIAIVLAVSLLNIHPFYLLMYIMLLTGFFIFGLFSKIISVRIVILKYLLSIFGIISINSYWIIPFLQGPLSGDSQAVYNNAGAVFKGFLSVASYINSINFFQYGNFFALNYHQTIFHYIFYFLIIFALVVTSFFLKNKKNFGVLLFLLSLYLLFFHLALGPVSKISGGTWLYLWEHAPFFSFFRSFTRYQAIIIPLYLFYFAIFNLDWEYKHKNRVYVVLIVLILLLNVKMLTGNLYGSIVATKIPDEYKKVNELFDRDKTSSNVVVFPNVIYEVYRWSANENRDIILQTFFLRDYLFDSSIISERASVSLSSRGMVFKDIFSGDSLKNIEENFRKMNIRYVIIQKDMIDNFTGESVKYEKYDDYFRSNASFSLIENNDNFNLYKFNEDSSVLIADNLSFSKLNPTKYRIRIKGISSKEDIIFLKNYSSQWKVFISEEKSDDFYCHYGEVAHIVSEKNISECLVYQKMFQWDDLGYIFKKPISGMNHEKSYGYANSWTIDPNYIKKNFSKDQYHENSDGSIDLELTLYFKPQAYFYLGMFISALTLFGCLGYLGYDFWRQRKSAGGIT